LEGVEEFGARVEGDTVRNGWWSDILGVNIFGGAKNLILPFLVRGAFWPISYVWALEFPNGRRIKNSQNLD
jgi:hypothetical protein